MLLNVVSAYVSATCQLEEKEDFWNNLDDEVGSIPRSEIAVI